MDPEKVSHYKIIEKLGAGSWGVVRPMIELRATSVVRSANGRELKQCYQDFFAIWKDADQDLRCWFRRARSMRT